jgi:hypothetical protein
MRRHIGTNEECHVFVKERNGEDFAVLGIHFIHKLKRTL